MDTFNHTLRIALCHAALQHDNVAHNVAVLETLMRSAHPYQPDLIVTPELAVSGYEFAAAIGLNWIAADVPRILDGFARLARQQQVALIIGTPRYAAHSGAYHNAAVFIDEQGQIVGVHDKIRVLPGHSEAWSRPGAAVQPVVWRGQRIGVLICSDAYTATLADEYVQQGANVLISLAAWAPGLYGPSGEWERRSRETGLPLLVCNRTGNEATMNFKGSSSVAVTAGRRVLDYSAERAALLIFDVAADDWTPRSEQFTIGALAPLFRRETAADHEAAVPGLAGSIPATDADAPSACPEQKAGNRRRR